MNNKILSVIKYMLSILFIYAGVYKISNVSLFKSQLYQSPLLPDLLIPYIAIGLPLFEICLGVVLIFAYKLDYIALMISFCLMVFFSLYLIILFTLYTKPPCSCGGILSEMSYPVHITFNIIFTLLSLFALYLYNLSRRQS